MIDIHSHILSGLDDGAAAFEISVNMARMAHEAGTTDLVASPHANTEYSYEPELIAERIVELQNAVGDVIKIHQGCDFHLSPQNIQTALRDPSRFSINGLGYLLVEFPEASLFQGIERLFSDLLSVGLTPIVTHPERNRYLAGDIPRLRRWVGTGIPLQITAQSLLGRFGSLPKQWCLQMLREGLVHFVASDAHDLIRRPPRLDEAKSFLVDHFDEQYGELLFEVHPRSVIEGQPLDICPIPPQPRKNRRWVSFGAAPSALRRTAS